MSVKNIFEKIKSLCHDYLPVSLKGWGIYLASMSAGCLLCGLVRKAAGSDTYVPLVFVLMTLIVSLLTEGYFYGILAALSSVFAVNWAFTYPYMKLDFSVYGYPLTFMTMLAVGVAVSTLTTRLKEQDRIRMESEKEKMRANLLRAVSHDLRTPLTTISGSIGVVLDDDGSFSEEQRRELLQDAKNDAEWLCRMVENLLSITRMGDDRENTLNKKPEMLEEVISETVVNFKKRCSTAINISVSVPDELYFVEMDAMLIEQVLLNLLDNAVTHGDDVNNIAINVTVDDKFTRVSVADDGKGIDERIIKHLFDGQGRLSELACADNNRYMGIGLSVCKTIVQAHGGEIIAKNLRNSGAEFSFTLPVERNDEYECEG